MKNSGVADLIFGAVIIGYLVHLYYKKEEYEKYVGLKLIGFFLLGAFRLEFVFNWYPIIIPIGFLLFWFILKNKDRKNNIIKKKAAILGVAILYSTLLSNVIYDGVKYRDITFDIKNISMDTLKNDYDTIRDELRLSWGTEILDFQLNYDNKKITLLQIYIEDKENNKRVDISIYNGDYLVRQSKIYENEDYFIEHPINEWETTTEELLDIIDNIDFKKYDNIDTYKMIYERDLYGIENEKSYMIDSGNYSYTKVPINSTIHNGSGIMYIPMERVSEGSWSSIDYEYYLTNFEISSNPVAYKDIDISIENININKSVEIQDIYEKSELIENLKSIHFTRWDVDGEIELKPDLFIKDNNGNSLGLCSEDKGFARRDIGETSVWYIVPTDLYDKINLYTMK